ncbi:fimbria major subunit [Phocaeicola sp. Sa1CVN1]|uniref:Fimbria major subunit n=1 Tax=Phocaeicola intestinalis TaxID=2762212 RepID=A0ABR8Y9A2_9BACT|nr:fimbria major subunit [Phocaeicola intestinalis]MBD8040784.1 fimbria major subunit [Phocaeicola intestinalis]
MKRNALTYLLLPFLLALLVTACKDDTLPASPAEEEEAGSGVYVSVVVNTGGSNASRVPTPGEGGDGPQAGTVEESTVHDLNVFFFQGDDGINSDANTEITHCLYFSQDNNNLFGGIGQGDYDAVYYSATEDVSDKLQIGERYNVLVIANAGDLSNNATLQTLGNLRDYQVSETITDDGYFLMSSESDAFIDIKANTPATAEPVSVNIERMTARVDCAWEDDYYEIDNSSAKVKIESAMLVNKYIGDTYAFKRITTSITDNTIEYLGDEIGDNDTPAENYVVDLKTLDDDFTPSATYYANYYPTLSLSENSEWRILDKNVTSTDESGTIYYRLDYTQENVFRVSDGFNVAACCTGIVFKTTYYAGGNTNGAGETRYYSYWIRHAADNNDEISPMEYAIVRNNIYQLEVTGFSVEAVTLTITVVPCDQIENNITFD